MQLTYYLRYRILYLATATFFRTIRIPYNYVYVACQVLVCHCLFSSCHLLSRTCACQMQSLVCTVYAAEACLAGETKLICEHAICYFDAARFRVFKLCRSRVHEHGLPAQVLGRESRNEPLPKTSVTFAFHFQSEGFLESRLDITAFCSC